MANVGRDLTVSGIKIRQDLKRQGGLEDHNDS